jgi:hypothetical protein
MKLWNTKNSKKDEKAVQTKLAAKELSDDLMAQITGGAGKGACHTASV